MYPKQFIRFFNGEGRSLLGSTLQRLGGDESFAAPIVVCNNDHRFLVREELARAGLEPQAVMLEPIARNTAAAVAVAALFAVRQDADAILLVMPSDHVIADTVGFLEDVRQAAQIAATGRLVLFGVKADEPHTGYGYIRQGAALDGANGGFAVDEFREKPDRAQGGGLSCRRRLLLEQRHLRVERARLSRRARAARSGDLQGRPRARCKMRPRTWISCGWTKRHSPPLPTSRSTTR